MAYKCWGAGGAFKRKGLKALEQKHWRINSLLYCSIHCSKYMSTLEALFYLY